MIEKGSGDIPPQGVGEKGERNIICGKYMVVDRRIEFVMAA